MTLLLFAVAIAAGVELAYSVLPAASMGVFAIWAPAGVLLGTLVLRPRREWSRYVLVTALIVIGLGLVHGDVRTAVVLGVASCLEASAGAWLLQRTARPAFTLNHVSHAFALALTAALVAVLGASVALLLTDGAGWAFWRSWWFMDAIGILLVAPIVIAWQAEMQHGRETGGLAGKLELALSLTLGAVMTHLVFGEVLDEVIRAPAFLLPFLLWPAFRFGSAGSATSVLIIGSLAMWHMMQGSGPLVPAVTSTDAWLLRAQGALFMAGVSFLLLASEVAERREIAAERARLVTELQTALAEIKTLQGFIPICAWCHKVRDDAGFWQRLEIYLDAHTDATVSHSICPACSDVQHQLLEQGLDAAKKEMDPAVTR